MPVDGDTELLRSVKAGLSLYVRLKQPIASLPLTHTVQSFPQPNGCCGAVSAFIDGYNQNHKKMLCLLTAEFKYRQMFCNWFKHGFNKSSLWVCGIRPSAVTGGDALRNPATDCRSLHLRELEAQGLGIR